MLHTEEIRNESDFKWQEWYSDSPLCEEFERAFSQELRDDRHLNEAKYYAVYDGDNESLLIKTFPREEDRADLSLARIQDCNIALYLKNALKEKIVTQCLGERRDRIFIPNVPASMIEVFKHLKSLHESEPIEGVDYISIGNDNAVRVWLLSNLPPVYPIS
jgi:hypothetical protein